VGEYDSSRGDLYPKKWTQAQFSFVSINN